MNLRACSAASITATFFTLVLGLCAIGADASSPATPSAVAQEDGAMSGGQAASSTPGSHGLPLSYVIPASASPAEVAAITYSIGQLDKPYVFGASGPDAFDCSGLTMAAWAQAGLLLQHSTLAQARSGSTSSPLSIAPGDLVLVPGDDGTLVAPEHVGLYLGSGLVLDAANEAIGIRVQSFDNFVQVGHGLSAIRHIA